HSYLLRRTLQDLLSQLGERQFARIHKSTAVNLAAIHTLAPFFKGDHDVQLRSGKTLLLSRRYKDGLVVRMQRLRPAFTAPGPDYPRFAACARDRGNAVAHAKKRRVTIMQEHARCFLGPLLTLWIALALLTVAKSLAGEPPGEWPSYGNDPGGM